MIVFAIPERNPLLMIVGLSYLDRNLGALK